jgi:hypothetical protein
MAKCLFQSGGGGGKSKLKPVTATANDVLKGKVIVDANGNPLTGTIESMSAQTITPSSSNKTVACNGKYMTGDISVKGDANLVASNIVSGKTIFGVAGNAQKFAQKMFSGKVASNSGMISYDTSRGARSLKHYDVTFDFFPKTYAHVCYSQSGSSIDSLISGALDKNGAYVMLIVEGVNTNYWTVTITANSKLINGKTIYFPVERYSVDGFAAGYY